MKSFKQYIFESEIQNLNEANILSKLTNWFKNLFKSEEDTISKYINGKDNQKAIKIDLKTIKAPDNPMKLKDVMSNKEEMNFIDKENIGGFPLTSKLLKNYNKNFIKVDPQTKKKTEYNVMIDRYFHVNGDERLYLGLILFDESIKTEDNYVNVFNTELAENLIENDKEVLEYINSIFEGNMKRKNFKGSRYNEINPQITKNFLSIGYKRQNNDQKILFKNFK